MTITQLEINQAYENHKSTHTGCVQDYFGVLYLEKNYGLSREDALSQVAFGGCDYGVDGYHFEKCTGNFYLLQFKWSKNVRLFKESLERLTDKGLSEIFTQKSADQKRNQLIDYIRSLLSEHRLAIKRVYIHFIFCGDATEADPDRNQSLDHLRENLESKKYIIDAFFGSCIDLTIEFRSTTSRTVGGVARVKKSQTYDLTIKEHLIQRGPNGEVMHVCFVPLITLREMYVNMGSRLLERNIRFLISEHTPPNRAITKALHNIIIEEKEHASVFAFNHVGVTLQAERVLMTEGSIKITEPRLLNGAQTVSTFNTFLEKHAAHPAIKNGSALLKDIWVLARVVSAANDEFVTNVTLNNNRQNPVQPWALRANDYIQRELHDAFRAELGIFYERQENAFDSLSHEQLLEMDIRNPRCIELQRLALTYLAAEGHVERMSKLKDVFENDNQYKETFNERRVKANLRHVILCYKIRQRLPSLIRIIEAYGVNKYYFIKRGKNLIWALLCQGLLNDSESVQIAEEKYAENLTIESNYTAILHDLTRRRLVPILREAIETKPFSQYIEKEKDDFVRTRAFYDRCFELGVKKFYWKQINLR